MIGYSYSQHINGTAVKIKPNWTRFLTRRTNPQAEFEFQIPAIGLFKKIAEIEGASRFGVATTSKPSQKARNKSGRARDQRNTKGDYEVDTSSGR